MDKYMRMEINSTAARILERLNSLDDLAVPTDKTEYESAEVFRAGFDKLQTTEKEELLTDLMNWAKSRQLSYETDATMLKNIEDFQAFFVDSLTHDLAYLSKQMDRWDGNLKSILKSIDMFHHQYQEMWGKLPHGSTGEKFSHLQLEKALDNPWELAGMSMEDRLKYYEQQQRHLIEIIKKMHAFMENAATELDDARRIQKETSDKLAEVMQNLENVKMSDAAKEELLATFRNKENQREGRLAGMTFATQKVLDVAPVAGRGGVRRGGSGGDGDSDSDGVDGGQRGKKKRQNNEEDADGAGGRQRDQDKYATQDVQEMKRKLIAQEAREKDLKDKVRELERRLAQEQALKDKVRELERRLEQEQQLKDKVRDLERKLEQEQQMQDRVRELERERQGREGRNPGGGGGDNDGSQCKLGNGRADTQGLLSDDEQARELAKLRQQQANGGMGPNNGDDLSGGALSAAEAERLKRLQQAGQSASGGATNAGYYRTRNGVATGEIQIGTQSPLLYEVPSLDTTDKLTQTDLSLMGVEGQIGGSASQPKESEQDSETIPPERFRHSLNLAEAKGLVRVEVRDPDDIDHPMKIREPEDDPFRHTIGHSAERRSPRKTKSHRGSLGNQTRAMPYMTLPLGGKQALTRSPRIGTWERREAPQEKPYTPLVSVRSIRYRPKDHSPILDDLVQLNLPRPFTGKSLQGKGVSEYPDMDIQED